MMKTVQEWLRELDTERLIEEYICRDPVQYDRDESNFGRTVGEIRDCHIALVRDLIERLRTVLVKKPKKGYQGVLFVYRIIRDMIEEPAFGFAHIDELLEKGDEADNYAYEFCEQAEIAGFLVADTPLTIQYIYELMADVMYEASFFGFEQEDLAGEWEAIRTAEKEIEDGTAELRPWDELKTEMEEEQGYPFDEESEDELELHRKIIGAVMDYSTHSMKKELTAVLELIKEETGK